MSYSISSDSPRRNEDDTVVTCETCLKEFGVFAQWESHQNVFHRSEETDESLYRCLLCGQSWESLSRFLTHETCVDASKRRICQKEQCVCPVCGFASLRPRLYDHIRFVHSTELADLDASDCFLCRPCFRAKSKIDLLVHLASWHPLAFVMHLQHPAGEQEESMETCKICGFRVAADAFRSHVIEFHCALPSKSPPESIAPEAVTKRPSKARKSLKRMTPKVPVASSVTETELVHTPSPGVLEENLSLAEMDQPSWSVDEKTSRKRPRMAMPAVVQQEQWRTCEFCAAEMEELALAKHLVNQECREPRMAHCAVCRVVVFSREAVLHVQIHCQELGLGGEFQPEMVLLVICGFQGLCSVCSCYAGPNHLCEPTQRGYNCVHCTKSFGTPLLFNVHSFLVHAEDRQVVNLPGFRKRTLEKPAEPEVPPARENERKCSKCGAGFCSETALELHYDVFHGDGLDEHDRQIELLLRVSNSGKEWTPPSPKDILKTFPSEVSGEAAPEEASKDVASRTKMQSPSLPETSRSEEVGKIRRLRTSWPVSHSVFRPPPALRLVRQGSLMHGAVGTTRMVPPAPMPMAKILTSPPEPPMNLTGPPLPKKIPVSDSPSVRVFSGAKNVIVCRPADVPPTRPVSTVVEGAKFMSRFSIGANRPPLRRVIVRPQPSAQRAPTPFAGIRVRATAIRPVLPAPVRPSSSAVRIIRPPRPVYRPLSPRDDDHIQVLKERLSNP